MTSYRLAALLLALALPFLSPGFATAGFDEGVAAYERGDYQTAFREFMPLAVAGDPSAQANIGLMYANGQGVLQNDPEAVRWYRMAADQGNAIAQSNLGTMYQFGRGVLQNDAEAVRWYRMAADQGNAIAQSNLGTMYQFGRGVLQNDAEAVRWYRMAADQGNAIAEINLGAMYGLGQGVPQSYAEEMRWYRRAAAQGEASAQFNLGVMYDRGHGVPQNYSEAVRWYRMAANQGEPHAQTSLGMMYDRGQGVPQNYVEAVRLYRMAAAQGEAKAQHDLGLMYVRGDGVPQDFVLAYVWLNVAAARLPQGERELSVEMRDKVAALLSPAQRVRAQEMARNWQPESLPVPEMASPPLALTDEEVLGKSAAVEDVQAKLAALAYDAGPADGVMGPKTRAAIRAFEADFGLPVDGEVSDRLIAKLSNIGADGGGAPAHIAAADTDSESTGAKTLERDAKERRLEGSGTGFAVSEDGQIVTNHHVVVDCAEVRVRPSGAEAVPVGALPLPPGFVLEFTPAVVVARDPGNDLALLKAAIRLPAAVLRNDRGIRAGDSVVAVGFPLPGLLASEANVTTGSVSALAGVGNDTRFLQMTTPVQPGNSGGPLLDLEGRVVGVVVGKLDALKVASVTGDIPQNVNFAIKASVLRSFLDASGAAVAPRDPLAEPAYPITLSPAAVGADAKAFTVVVECWK